MIQAMSVGTELQKNPHLFYLTDEVIQEDSSFAQFLGVCPNAIPWEP